MTGEMYSIDQDGNDSNGDCWTMHAAIAKAIGGTLQPFDVYQGPYILIGKDIRIGNSPYAIAPTGLGVKRLWLISDDGVMGKIYREDTETESFEFFIEDEKMAIDAAKSLF